MTPLDAIAKLQAFGLHAAPAKQHGVLLRGGTDIDFMDEDGPTYRDSFSVHIMTPIGYKACFTLQGETVERAVQLLDEAVDIIIRNHKETHPC